MDYFITNTQKSLYIRLNKNGTPETCTKQAAQRFENSKARNILDHLPKTLKMFHFQLEAIPEIKENISNNIKCDGTVVSESISQWIEKFGMCGDILKEAEDRERQLIQELKASDNEILDLLHIVELENSKDLYSGWKLYKRIRENRKKRRNIKDEILIVENVLRNIKNTSCFHREQVQKAIDGLLNRKYSFRIIEDGGDGNDIV